MEFSGFARPLIVRAAHGSRMAACLSRNAARGVQYPLLGLAVFCGRAGGAFMGIDNVVLWCS